MKANKYELQNKNPLMRIKSRKMSKNQSPFSDMKVIQESRQNGK